jgi:protein O-GlcNAc transferase
LPDSRISAPDAFERAVWLYRAGNLREAERVCKSILRKKPATPAALHLLAAMEIQRDRLDRALDLINRALRFKPDYADALADRGSILQSLNRHQEADASFAEALALRPDDVAILYSRGVTLVALHRNDDALRTFDHVLALTPDHVQALNNRGGILHRLNRLDEALASYEQALKLQPSHIEALTNRGVALTALARHDEALASLDRSLALRPDDAEALYYRGFVLSEMNRCEDAAASYQKALAVQPGHAKARLALCMSALPALYMDEPEIARRRADYAQRLDALRREIAPAPAAFAEAIGARQPFYLAYQGYNDRDLQAIYGAMVCDVMAARHPAPRLAPVPGPDEPVRVGIVSGFFREHSNWKIPIKGWISRLDRGRFRLFGYSTGTREDAQTTAAAALCERFVRGPLPLDAWREAILADAPHVLIYPEVGMDNVAVQLAAQRLARVQCTSWGHPDTSGLPTLDYYLSGDLMEPADAPEHYTERLVRLPNLSIYYEPLKTPAAPIDRQELRAQLGLRADATVFWCGQSLFKYLPQFDRVFPAIARAVGDCQFVFIRHHGAQRISDLFLQRLATAFASDGLNAADCCVMLPRLETERFAAAIGCCDIVLDSIGWSGCNSTLEGLVHDLPVVTVAGALMRGCHTAAILAMMGVTETIAETVDQYVAIAARLARDPAWRDDVKRRIAEHKHRVYRDDAPIAALDAFLSKVAREPAPPAPQ